MDEKAERIRLFVHSWKTGLICQDSCLLAVELILKKII